MFSTMNSPLTILRRTVERGKCSPNRNPYFQQPHVTCSALQIAVTVSVRFVLYLAFATFSDIRAPVLCFKSQDKRR